MSQVWTSDLATEWLTPFYTKSEKKNKKNKKKSINLQNLDIWKQKYKH